MSKFVILHLSDAHFRVDKSAISTRVLRAIITAIEKHVEIYGRPHLIVFSGDLAFSGKPEEYAAAESWLKSVQEKCGAPIFIVPGNHDVARPKTGTTNYCRSLSYARESEEKFNDLRSELAKGKFLTNFQRWHSDFRARNADVISDWSHSLFHCEHFARLNNVPVVLIGLNTALTSFHDSEEGNLVCDAAAVDEVLAKYDGRENSVVAMVVTHHPVGFSTGGSGPSRCMEKWNDEDLQERLLRGTGPHLYLHGHLHDQKGATLSLSSGQHLAILAAGAAYTSDKYPLRFSFIEVDVDSRYIAPYVYSYSRGSGRWTLQNSESNQFLAALPKQPEHESPLELIDPLTQVRALYQATKNLLETLDDDAQQKFRVLVQRDFAITLNDKPLDKVIAEFSSVGKSAQKRVSQAIRMVMTGKVREGVDIVSALVKTDRNLEPLLFRMLVASPLREHWEMAERFMERLGTAFDHHAMAYGYWSDGDLDRAISLSEVAVDKAKKEGEDAILIRSMSNLAYYYASRGLKKDGKTAKALAEQSFGMLNLVDEEHKAMYYQIMDTTGFVLATYGGKADVDRGVKLIEQAKDRTVPEDLRQKHLEAAYKMKTAHANRKAGAKQVAG